MFWKPCFSSGVTSFSKALNPTMPCSTSMEATGVVAVILVFLLLTVFMAGKT